MGNKITWLVDEHLLDRHDDVGFPSLADAAIELGHHVIKSRYIPFSDGLSSDLELDLTAARYDGSECLVAYGTVGFIRQFEQFNKFDFGEGKTFCPGSYLKKNNLKYSVYSTIYGKHMLNDDFIMLPWGEIRRRNNVLLQNFKENVTTYSSSLFIRPDDVTKEFAGRVFTYSDQQLSDFGQGYPISDETLCIVAPEKEILSEYRHVICDGELIAQSQYRRDGKLDIRVDVENECQSLAKFIARNENDLNWSPDYAYVVDTAMTQEGAKIIEFNAFSCSGLYACDTRVIVDRVSHMAWKEYTGEL